MWVIGSISLDRVAKRALGSKPEKGMGTSSEQTIQRVPGWNHLYVVIEPSMLPWSLGAHQDGHRSVEFLIIRFFSLIVNLSPR